MNISMNRDGCGEYAGCLLELQLHIWALVVSNPVTGFLFWFDAENHYLRGPLNRVGYYLMAVEVLIILGCALLNWKHLNDSARQVIRTLPPAVILLTIFQLLYPDNLLNGGIMVITDIIMLFNFQSHRIEVDSLTGLGNRGCLYQQMERRIPSAKLFSGNCGFTVAV